jgi:diaminohydroxyphosphoribosylaminopyrimidine deaminase / 5-amino-6-(5-phosphoribosylamino)uracil reductase
LSEFIAILTSRKIQTANDLCGWKGLEFFIKKRIFSICMNFIGMGMYMDSSISEADRLYMKMALSLAEKGRGTTSPNPMVGAIIVREGEIIGKGFHLRTGGDHAEIVALKEAGDRANGATLYVTLEPCCHYGKTPPCTDAIVKSGIKRVIFAMLDPNPLVCGGGFESLRQHNIVTVSGVLENSARKLNESYIKFISTGIPFLTLKIAITMDGRIAAADCSSKWITGPEARKRVHILRSWSDAVMVGVGTVLSDDPSLTVRDAEGSDPVRVILDHSLRSPLNAKIFSDNNVILFTGNHPDEEKLKELNKRGIEVWKSDCIEGKISLEYILKKLGKKSITGILCEGGSTLASSLLREKLVDKVCVFIAPKILGSGMNGFSDLGIETLSDAIYLKDREIEEIGDDILITGYTEYRK